MYYHKLEPKIYSFERLNQKSRIWALASKEDNIKISWREGGKGDILRIHGKILEFFDVELSLYRVDDLYYLTYECKDGADEAEFMMKIMSSREE